MAPLKKRGSKKLGKGKENPPKDEDDALEDVNQLEFRHQRADNADETIYYEITYNWTALWKHLQGCQIARDGFSDIEQAHADSYDVPNLQSRIADAEAA
jgi:hypothetical protein